MEPYSHVPDDHYHILHFVLSLKTITPQKHNKYYVVVYLGDCFSNKSKISKPKAWKSLSGMREDGLVYT